MKIKIKDFLPEHTFLCGQCFRWEKEPDGSFIGIANSQVVRVSTDGEDTFIDGITKEDYESFWERYLDIKRD